MKFRYMIRTWVEAESIEQAIRIARRTKPHEVIIDSEVWKERGYAIRDNQTKKIGFDKK